MALEFPSNPTNGQVFDDYFWDASIGAWRGIGSPNNLATQLGAVVARQYNPNVIINGAMDIWQRGTSFTAIGTNIYSADRWKQTTTTLNGNITRDTIVPSSQFNYSLKAVPASNGTPLNEWAIRQMLEQQNINHFAGQVVTLSFWYRSTKTSHKARISCINSTGGTDITQSFTVAANTWTKISLPFNSFAAVTAWTGANNAEAGFVDIGFADSTALTTSDNFYVTGVQLEVGQTSTPFRRNANSIQAELNACLRYYSCSLVGTAGGPTPLHVSDGGLKTAAVKFPVEMRVAPTFAITSSAAVVTNGISSKQWYGYSFTAGERYIDSWTASAEL